MHIVGQLVVFTAFALAGCGSLPQALARNETADCTQNWLALEGRVTDADHLLSAPARVRLENSLAGIEARTGHQMVIATVPSLQGKPVEEYSRALPTIGASAAPQQMTGSFCCWPGMKARCASKSGVAWSTHSPTQRRVAL